MADSIIRTKSFAFALQVIELYKFLTEEKKEYVLSKQLLRSGTSIGANVEEALGAQSRKDFLAKISIAYKEVRETNYWLCLLTESKYISLVQYESMHEPVEELLRLIGSAKKTTQTSLY